MVTIKGANQYTHRIKILAKRFPRAMGAALYQEALILFGVSQRRVPVDTGRLRASGLVPPPEFSGGAIEQMVAYGTDYALPVHENSQNAKFFGEGEKEYLRSAFDEALGGLLQRLAKRTIENEKRGIGLTPLPEIRSEGKVGASRSKKRAAKKRAAKRRAGKKRNSRGQFI